MSFQNMHLWYYARLAAICPISRASQSASHRNIEFQLLQVEYWMLLPSVALTTRRLRRREAAMMSPIEDGQWFGPHEIFSPTLHG
jgi:hypothetical protein